MNKEFIPYEFALKLKELGYNEKCFGGYIYKVPAMKWELEPMISDNSLLGVIAAPTFSQAFRFFREKYKLHSYIEGAYPWFRFYINSNDDRAEGFKHLIYEEAELACLKKLIEIVGKSK